MKPLGLDYFKTLKVDGKEMTIKDVKYVEDGTYTVICEELKNPLQLSKGF